MITKSHLTKNFYQHRFLYTILLISVISAIFTWPAFANDYLSLSWDGRLHLARFEQIVQSLKSGQLPPLVSSWGFDHQLSAISSMYPWVGSSLFFLPHLFINNPLRALKLGFWLVNFATGVSIYLLCRELTKKWWLQLTGILLYLLNTYHLIVMYARIDLGEMITFACLPLILKGCLQIWRKNNTHTSNGYLWLALGMTGIANAHILSLFIIMIILIIVEVIRLYKHVFSWKEFTYFALAAFLSVLSASYSLTNILYMVSHNHMLTPGKSLAAINPITGFNALLNNQLSEHSDTWNLGLVFSLILIFIGLKVILTSPKSNTSRWRIWYTLTISLFIATQAWWPYSFFAKTPLGLIQFPGRLLNLVALFGTVAIVQYFNSHSVKIKNILLLNGILMMMSFNAIYQYATAPQNPATNAGRIQLTNENYYSTIDAFSNLPTDYHPIANGHNLEPLKPSKGLKLTTTKILADQVDYQIKVKSTRNYHLPINNYQGVDYDIRLNEHPVRSLTKYQMTLPLKKGTNHLSIHLSTPTFNVITMAVSLLSLLGTSALLLLNHYKFQKTNK